MPKQKKDFSTPIEYEFYSGKNRLVLKRIKGQEETLPCPFCGTGHIHGAAEGHRCAHCATGCKAEVTAPDGTILRQKDDYILRNI